MRTFLCMHRKWFLLNHIARSNRYVYSPPLHPISIKMNQTTLLAQWKVMSNENRLGFERVINRSVYRNRNVFFWILVCKHTDKKENQIFLRNREIPSGELQSEEGPPNIWGNAKIFPRMRRPLVIYDFATAPLWIFLYMTKTWFSFLSVQQTDSYMYSSSQKRTK
jgi:hypothetical protein